MIASISSLFVEVLHPLTFNVAIFNRLLRFNFQSFASPLYICDCTAFFHGLQQLHIDVDPWWNWGCKMFAAVCASAVTLCCALCHCQLADVAFFVACFAANFAVWVVVGFAACLVASVVASFVFAFVASGVVSAGVVSECLYYRITLLCLLPVHPPSLLQMLLRKGTCCNLYVVNRLCEQFSTFHASWW